MGKRIDLKDLQQYIDDKGFIVQNHCWNVRKLVIEAKKMQKQFHLICLDLVKAIPMHMFAQREMVGI